LIEETKEKKKSKTDKPVKIKDKPKEVLKGEVKPKHRKSEIDFKGIKVCSS